MYVDESGVEAQTDNTKYFVVSGVVVHENHLSRMKKMIQHVKDAVFVGKLKGVEIHVHDIYKCKSDFYGLTHNERDQILEALYSSISNMPFSIISVVIDKSLLSANYKSHDVLETAYTFLVERFDKFLTRTCNKGIMKIDKTSNKLQSLNARDKRVLGIINSARRHGTSRQKIRNIVEEPDFYDSSQRKMLQAADAVAYCTNRHLGKSADFDAYWDYISEKAQKSYSGRIDGYGLTVFPDT